MSTLNTKAKTAAPIARTPAAVDPKAAPSEEAIRQRAFQLFQARNGGPGDATSDWIQAELELKAPGKRAASLR
jgi:hypothetical protein